MLSFLAATLFAGLIAGSILSWKTVFLIELIVVPLSAAIIFYQHPETSAYYGWILVGAVVLQGGYVVGGIAVEAWHVYLSRQGSKADALNNVGRKTDD